jgi:zinc ribbon protein
MAGFCTKCGAPLASSTGFCSSCGAPVGAGVVTPQQQFPSAPPPAYGQPGAYPAGPPQSSSTALKVVLIVVAVVVGLGILAACGFGYFAWRVARTATVDNKGGVTVSVPGGGTFSAGESAPSEAELGVPVYPGAATEKGGVTMNAASASMVIATLTTSDSSSQVVDFYKSRMGSGAVVASSGDGTVLSVGASDSDRIMVTVGEGSGDDSGKTTIVIMHTKKR